MTYGRADNFWQSPTYKIICAMKATGYRQGIISQWRDMVERMALNMTGPDALAIRAWLPLWQVRPFYTAKELAPLFPALSLALGFTTRLSEPKSPARLANELRMGQLPMLNMAGADGWRLFIVERIPYWWSNDRTQEEIENAFNQ